MLNLEESLEALEASVMNAVWAADIEKQFQLLLSRELLEANPLNRGIARFCQQSALLSSARLFDKSKQATSLKKFLECFDKEASEFPQATKTQVKASVTEHCEWIEKEKDAIEQIITFRDKQIAHLDKSSVRGYFDGELAGVRNILEPDVVELSSRLLEDVLKIVNI